MKLSQTFEAVVCKKLVACDLPKRHSHQHELTGVRELRSILGTESKVQGHLVWVLFPDEARPLVEENDFTFYDARAKSALRTGRSEWRLYYQGNFLDHATMGDLLVFTKTRTRGLVAVVLTKSSRAYDEALGLFGLTATSTFRALPTSYLESHTWNAGETPTLARWFQSRRTP